MAGSLEQVLASMPGLSGYLAKKQFDNQQSNQELQGLVGGMGLLAQIQARQEQEHAKNALAQTGGDPEKAAKVLLQTGNYKAAASLAPLIKSQTDASQPKFAPSRSPGYFQNGKWVATPENQTPTPLPLERMIQIRDSLAAANPNDPKIKIYDQAITHQTNPQAQRIIAPPQPSPPVAVIGADGKPTLVRREESFGKTPASFAAEKVLLPSLQKQLTEASELADTTDRFRTTFKDEYAGKTITGELSNVAGRYLGDETGQAQWWQDYELHQSQVRNKLFGSALTAPEIAAWNKSAINPRMDSGEVRKNLIRRDQLERNAIDRLIKGATAGRYSKEQIEAFTGRAVTEAPKPTVGASEYVETRRTAGGRLLGKKRDGSIEEIKE